MNINQLRYFVAVGNHLNFSRAAESLYISQPSLSYHVSELESELGMKLFERSRHSVSLTPSGAALMEEATALLARFDGIPSHLKNLGKPVTPGTFRIAFDPGVFFSPKRRHLFVNTVTQMKDVFPDTQVLLDTGDSDSLQHLLQTDKADIILGVDLKDVSSCNTITIPADNLRIAVPLDCGCREGHPEDLEQYLKSKPLYLVNRDTKLMARILTYFGENGITPEIKLCSDPIIPLISAELGAGAAIIPPDILNLMGYDDLLLYEIEKLSVANPRSIQWKKSNMHPMINYFISSFVDQDVAQWSVPVSQL